MRNSASAAHVLGIEGRNFKLGFAPGDKAAMDILGTQANRKFVETLLHEITGKDWTLKLTVNEELASKSAAVPKHSPSHDFKDEPLIQEAIELFNATSKIVNACFCHPSGAQRSRRIPGITLSDRSGMESLAFRTSFAA